MACHVWEDAIIPYTRQSFGASHSRKVIIVAPTVRFTRDTVLPSCSCNVTQYNLRLYDKRKMTRKGPTYIQSNKKKKKKKKVKRGKYTGGWEEKLGSNYFLSVSLALSLSWSNSYMVYIYTFLLFFFNSFPLQLFLSPTSRTCTKPGRNSYVCIFFYFSRSTCSSREPTCGIPVRVRGGGGGCKGSHLWLYPEFGATRRVHL